MSTCSWKRALRVCFVCLLMLLGISLTAQAATVVNTDVSTARNGYVLLGLEGEYITQVSEAVALVNSYRLEACREGVRHPKTGKRLTMNDYVPIKWSGDLEYIARIRAAESHLTMNHVRTNGSAWSNISSPNRVGTYSENIAYNLSSDMLTGIRQWYSEKEDWVKQNTGKETGHYTSMINPEYRYMGMGTFYTTDTEYYLNCTAQEFSMYSGLSQTPMSNPGKVVQLLEIPSKYVSGLTLAGPSAGIEGKAYTYTLSTKVSMSEYAYMQIMNGVTWSSSNTAVAQIRPDSRNSSSAVLSVTGCGSTTISASYGGSVKKITFTSSHAMDSGKVVSAATCVSKGVKAYTCSACGNTRTEETAALGHSWNAGIVTSAATTTKTGNRKYTCKTCGATKNETIPKLPAVRVMASTKGTTALTAASFTVQMKSSSVNGVFTVTRKASGGYDVTFKRPYNANASAITIPDTITVSGTRYKVTAIAANAFKNNKKVQKIVIGKNVSKIGAGAFYNCSKLKNIQIKSSKLTAKSIGKNAFAKIYKKAVIKVPAKQLKAYKKLLKAAGMASTVKVK